MFRSILFCVSLPESIYDFETFLFKSEFPLHVDSKYMNKVKVKLGSQYVLHHILS